MAKKISKHSRAARRNELDDGEVKSLSSLPRAEKTDLTSAIIRATTKKNEDLLNDKMKKKDKSSITKDLTQKAKENITNQNKLKMQKAIMQSDILQDKILKSKQRSKFVQTARKQNWDAINQAAFAEKAKLTGQQQDNDESKNGDDSTSAQDEDAMEEEEDFFNEEQNEPQQKQQRNAFDLLNDEVEC